MNKATRITTATIIAAVGATLILTGCGKSKSKKEYEKAMSEVDADVQKMNARMKKEAKQQDRVQRDIKQREADRLARAKREREEDEEREKTEALDAARDAMTAFPKMVLTPNVAISTKLRSFGASTEFRGEDIQALQELHAKQDWNGLIKRVGFGPDKKKWLSSTSPSVQAVNQTKWKLDRAEFSLLLKSRTALPFEKPLRQSFYTRGEKALYFVSIPSRFNRMEDEPFRWNLDWEEHPDGNAYLHKWDTHCSQIFVFLAEAKLYSGREAGSLEDKLYELSREYQDAARKLVQKKKLGELSESALNSQIHRLRSGIRGKLTALLSQY